jgi:hypothetical protein
MGASVKCVLRVDVAATWKEKFELEGAILVRRLAWAVYKHVKVSQIVVVRDRADARHSVFALGHSKAYCTRQAHGSAIRRSVSLMILLGRAMVG